MDLHPFSHQFSTTSSFLNHTQPNPHFPYNTTLSPLSSSESTLSRLINPSLLQYPYVRRPLHIVASALSPIRKLCILRSVPCLQATSSGHPLLASEGRNMRRRHMRKGEKKQKTKDSYEVWVRECTPLYGRFFSLLFLFCLRCVM